MRGYIKMNHWLCITNKNKWSGHLMGKAMRTTPKADFELIDSRMEK